MTKYPYLFQKSVSFYEDDVKYIQRFAEKHGLNFSEALRFMITVHGTGWGFVAQNVPRMYLIEAVRLGVDVPKVIRDELQRQIEIKNEEQKVLKDRAAMCNTKE